MGVADQRNIAVTARHSCLGTALAIIFSQPQENRDDLC
jgi:hypothetical protein